MNFDVAPWGAYIWSSYAVTVVALGGLILWTVMQWRAAKAKLASLEKNT